MLNSEQYKNHETFITLFLSRFRIGTLHFKGTWQKVTQQTEAAIEI